MSEETAWDFAQKFYACPGMSRALLQLQDDHGIDVPLLLVLLHGATVGKVLDKACAADLVGLADEWQHQVIQPLRESRRSLGLAAGGLAGALYEQAKAAELAAEEALIRRLVEAWPEGETAAPETAADQNLTTYRQLAGRFEGQFDAVLLAFKAYVRENAR